MKRLAGQAGRTIGYLFHHTGMIIMTAFFVAAIGLGLLAYRLSLGPLQIPWITSRLANAVSGRSIDIHVGQAALAWAGYKHGGGAPLYLRLGDITVTNAAGAMLATIPDANLVFLPKAMFSAQAPILIDSSDAHLAGSDVAVSLVAGIRLRAGFKFSQASLDVTLGAGELGPPGFGEPMAAGRFLLEVNPNSVVLTNGVIDLAAIGGSAPVIGVAGTATRDSAWHGAVTLRCNSVQARDLADYWPAQWIPLTRAWVIGNITAGAAHDASFTLGLSAPLGLASLNLDTASGGFRADDLTLTWMTGVQPITQLDGGFTLADRDDIDIAGDTGRLGGIMFSAAHMHIAGVSQPKQTGTLEIPVHGSLQDALTVLNGPNLHLLKAVPAPVLAATGAMTGMVDVALPMQPNLTLAEVNLHVHTVLSHVAVPLPVKGLGFTQGSVTVDATAQNLLVKGDARLAGQAASFTSTADFGSGAARFDMQTTANTATLDILGLNAGDGFSGSAPVAVRVVDQPPGDGSVSLQADLTPAKLSLPAFGWTKPVGAPGRFTLAATIHGVNFAVSRIDSIDAQAPGFDIESQVAGGGINLTRIHIGDTDGSGRIVPPANAAAPWKIDLFGTRLDASAELNPPAKTSAQKPLAAKITTPQPPSGPLWDATTHFDTLVLAEKNAPVLGDFNFEGNGQGNSIFGGSATAMLAPGETVALSITPGPGGQPGDAESLQLETTDGGGFLRALGAYDDISGGVLTLDASYGVTTPLTGATTMTNFRLLNAPAFGKILQGLTIYGVPEATSGPGLTFNKLVAPFSITSQVMTLKNARAFSASLGFTASGTIDLGTGIYDIHGTVVPAYALNALPGKIPIIGRLFSPEKGGGLFAMRYTLTGAAADPKVTINPLSALTPGFLRGIFGLGGK